MELPVDLQPAAEVPMEAERWAVWVPEGGTVSVCAPDSDTETADGSVFTGRPVAGIALVPILTRFCASP